MAVSLYAAGDSNENAPMLAEFAAASFEPGKIRLRQYARDFLTGVVSVPDDAPKVNYRLPGFLSKFWELQQVMWTTNQGLTDRHTFDSRPDSWPRLRRGIVRVLQDFHQAYVVNITFYRTSGSRTTARSTSSATPCSGG